MVTDMVMVLAIMVFGRDPQTKTQSAIADLPNLLLVGMAALGIMALVGWVGLDTHRSTVVTTIFHTLDMDTEGRRALEASF